MRAAVDTVWMEVARAVAKRSACERSQVGCVIVGADGRVAATGYNGPPAGYPTNAERCSAYCPRGDTAGPGEEGFTDCVAVHAELNALLYSDRHARLGGTAYITRDPCWDCAKALAGSGIARVVWPSVQPLTERLLRVTGLLSLSGLVVAGLDE